jgi:NADH-ubiquinone oxidoreductase-F iron-sulfur binding region
LGRAVTDELERLLGPLGERRGKVISPAQLDTPLDFDSMRQMGSGLGAAGFAVFDDSAYMVQAAYRYSRFLFVESCGQCPACKFGTGEVTQTLAAIEVGGGSDRDLELILVRASGSTGGQKCALPTGESLLMQEPGPGVPGRVRQPRREVVSPAPRASLPQARRLGRHRSTVRLRPGIPRQATRLDLPVLTGPSSNGGSRCATCPAHGLTLGGRLLGCCPSARSSRSW